MSNVSNRLLDEIKRKRPLPKGGGDDTFGGMSDRLTALETHFEYVRRDMEAMKAAQDRTNDKLDKIVDAVGRLPTKSDLWAWKIQYTAISLAAVALIVGGIIGGLGWLKP